MAIDLVLGLGNPGEEYVRTRHNVGFRVVEEILRRHGGTEWLLRPTCELAVITTGRRDGNFLDLGAQHGGGCRLVVVARPVIFMNRSGEAALWLLDELELTPDRMLVVVDDVDLPLATVRLRRSGGPGTHNGLRDLCEKIGNDFPRLRVGAQGADMSGDLADYVLSPFSDDEEEVADGVVLRAADAIEMALQKDFETAMNAYNRPQQFSTDSAPR